jgi:hypothetical protein
MLRRAACVGLLLALGGCKETVVLQDVWADAAASVFDSGGGGHDRSPRADSDPGCAGFATAMVSQSPQIMILLDRSSNMEGYFPGGTTKQAAVQNALLDAIDTYQSHIKFGFESFPGDSGSKNNTCVHPTCCAGKVSVDPGVNQKPLIASSMSCTDQQCPSASYDSPSYDALSKIHEYYPMYDYDDRYVLLVTASEPSCSWEGSTTDLCSTAKAAATELVNDGVPVVVLSIGYQPDTSSNSKSCLFSLSNVGGGGNANGGMPANTSRLYSPTTVSALKQNLSDLFSAMAKKSCTFSTSSSVPDGATPKVWVGSESIAAGGADGWAFNGLARSQIILSGAACTKYLDSPLGTKVMAYWCSN